MPVKRVMAKAAGVLGGAAIVGTTLLALPAHAATFECAVTVLGFPPITMTVTAPTVGAAEAQVRILIPRLTSVSCHLA
ncbi:hypothetical protein ACQP2T_23440 [Nonomuraea sp. CA-143628]|uniref:hypothetical protein n=1 Tax=Nonomuraea sp. CA-143628 TaxID=3239997 RepID=UPI003D9237AD